jgi:hypothetical protein
MQFLLPNIGNILTSMGNKYLTTVNDKGIRSIVLVKEFVKDGEELHISSSQKHM